MCIRDSPRPIEYLFAFIIGFSLSFVVPLLKPYFLICTFSIDHYSTASTDKDITRLKLNYKKRPYEWHDQWVYRTS